MIIQNSIKEILANILPEIIQIRHDLHKIPELAYNEIKTSAYIAKVLQEYGYEVQQNVGKTGIVAILDSGLPGPTVALRADMDALPFQENNNLPYKSIHANVMHACGHDGHCATLLAVAYILQKIKHQLKGKIKLIFQPAEEGGKGSLAMINEGALTDVTAIFGYHNWPGLPTGIIGVKDGPILAGNGRFEISINGKIAHTSQPENAINPVIIGSIIINELEKYRIGLDNKQIIINVTHFSGGMPNGAMSDSGKIIGLYYVDSPQSIEEIQKQINFMCKQIADSSGAMVKVLFTGFLSPTINTPQETLLVLNAAKKLLPDKNIQILERCMIASEDFSEYLKMVPGCFFLVGAGEKHSPVHTPQFDFNDDIIANAALVLSQSAIDYIYSYS